MARFVANPVRSPWTIVTIQILPPLSTPQLALLIGLQEMMPGQDAREGYNHSSVGWARPSRELLFELGQIDLSEGTATATNQRVAQAIEIPVEQARKLGQNRRAKCPC